MRVIELAKTVAVAALLPAGVHAQHTAHAATPPKQANPRSDAALIANALSAAPASIATIATVRNHDGRILRQGTSDWVCMPDIPDAPNDSPMCLDAPWRDVIAAWMSKTTPTVTRMGFGYMLQGDLPVSNVDPFATAPTATNQWIATGDPHVMILVPDKTALDSLPSDPRSGGPFVMWKGTPYAHIMVPVTKAPRR